MAGVSNQVFRRFARRYGASVVYTEMISCMGLKYGSHRTEDMMSIHPEEQPVVIQIFGGEPGAMAEAARHAEAAGAAYIDINMACPVPKVTKGGGGSALIGNHDLALEIFEAVQRATALPVTVKLRSALRSDDNFGVELGRKLAAAGAAALALHPRSAIRRYEGPADWSKIAELKAAVSVPVWGSGDVFTAADVVAMLDQTGCDGVMIARGAMGNFWIFKEAAALLAGEQLPPETYAQRLEMAREFVIEMALYLGEDRGLRQSRKHLLWFLKGIPGGSHLKAEASSASSVTELTALIDNALEYISKCPSGAS